MMLSNSSYEKNLDLSQLLFIYYFLLLYFTYIYIIQLSLGGGGINLMFFMQIWSCDTTELQDSLYNTHTVYDSTYQRFAFFFSLKQEGKILFSSTSLWVLRISCA